MSYIKSYHIFTHYVILNWRSDTQASTAFVPWCNVDRPTPRWAVRRTPRNRWRAKMAWLPWHCHVGSTLFEGWNCESFMNFCQCWCKRFLLERDGKGMTSNTELWIEFNSRVVDRGNIFWATEGPRVTICSCGIWFAYSACNLMPAEVGQNGKIHLEEGRTDLRNQRNLSKHWKICLGHQFVSTNAIMIASQDMMKLIELVYAFLHRWSLSTFSAWLQTQNAIIYPRITVLICCSKTEPEGLYE